MANVHYRTLLALVISVSLLAGCGGGGGGSSTPGGGGGGGGGGTGGSSGTQLSSSGGTITLPTSNGITPTITYPSNNISGTVKVTFAATSGTTPYSNARAPKAATGLAAYTMNFSGTTQSVTFTGGLSLSYSGTATNLILEIFDITQIANTSFTNPIATCPETSSSGTVTFTCSGTISIASPTDTFEIEIVSGSSLVSSNAFTCPSSDDATSVARSGVSTGELTRHHVTRFNAASMKNAGEIAVVYDRATFQRSSASFSRAEANVGGTVTHAFDYPRLGKTIHVIGVSPSQAASAIAALRSQPGVVSVSQTERRATLLSQAYIVSNHYFGGFAPYNVQPYYEGAASPGQWDMHAIGMEHVFGYSQSGSNAPGAPYANALGTHTTKIAIIDTGQDTLHPDLAANVVYQKCFITPVNNAGFATGPQSTSNFSTDPFGHGTDVSGIAAAVTNPSNIPSTTNGFAGAGGNAGIMAYRVFPTPDDTCEGLNSDNQCGADTADIADAINDAVAQGAKVISMSLGGGNCVTPTGQNPSGDSDPVEGAAIYAAYQANVIVVAASGNESTSVTSRHAVDAPACDTGVIAVGATSLDDGVANGSSSAGRAVTGTTNSPVEYVAYYSNAGSTNAYGSSTSWGIVAPGGDPSSDEDADDLHWIENIWTSTPFQANSTDSTYVGECTDDYPSSTATIAPVDCRTLIAGTSMSTPHVAGVAALICGLNAADCNPTSMKNLLCMAADNINDSYQGCGRLNAYRAVATALGDPSPP